LGKSKFPKSKRIYKLKIYWKRKAIVLDKSISKQLKDKTILITGAAGSIGSENSKTGVGF
jgi:FlaA1/EpsC-like NDP-sugar epimerase